MGQVRDIRLCLEMIPDGVLECWSVGKKCLVPVFTDQIILRSKSILLLVFVHYSITPALQYSILVFSKQTPFRGNSSRSFGLDSLCINIDISDYQTSFFLTRGRNVILFTHSKFMIMNADGEIGKEVGLAWRSRMRGPVPGPLSDDPTAPLTKPHNDEVEARWILIPLLKGPY